MNNKIIFFILLMTITSNSYSNAGLNDQQRNTRFDDNCETSLMPNSIENKLKKIDTHGGSFYIYPEEIEKSFTGCQIVWLANGHKLVTKHYRDGKLTWVRGQEPKEILPYFCLYEDNKLLKDMSFNVKRCPDSTEELK